MTHTEFRQARQSLSLTQAQIAREMGVTVNTVSRWEQGVHPVNEGLARLAIEVIRQRREAEAVRRWDDTHCGVCGAVMADEPEHCR